jgi:transcription termination factor Rho
MSISALTGIAKKMDVPVRPHAQTGADLQSPRGADGEERPDLFGRRARNATGWIRISARPGIQLPAGPDDIYVSPSQIRKFDLRTGDTISGQIRPPKEGERYFALIKVEASIIESPEQRAKKFFIRQSDASSIPRKCCGWKSRTDNLLARVIDLGDADRQRTARALVVSPPRTG